MTAVTIVDAEDLVKAWLLTTSVASLVSNKIFEGIPKGSPIPSVILYRAGGAPRAGSTVPEDVARISFDCWGSNRPQCKAIVKALVSEIESLAYTNSYEGTDALLVSGETLSVVWLPDPVSDTPRYALDALFSVLAK
jgi:uncharacterized protein DUF3168